MFHAEAIYRRRVIVSNLLLLGIKSHALADDGGSGAVHAPDGIWHLEADGKNPLGDFVSASTEGVLSVKLVAADDTLLVGGDIASHIETLHLGRIGALDALLMVGNQMALKRG